MWQYLVLACWIVRIGHAFIAGPMWWEGRSARKFALAARPLHVFDVEGQPQQLTLRIQRDRTFPNTGSYFVPKSDNTIELDATDLCIEASGDQNGDAVHVDHCTGQPLQLWNFVSSGTGRQNQIQLAGTKQCIGIDAEEGDLDGISVELLDCSKTAAQSWNFEGQRSFPTKGPAGQRPHSYSMRHVAMSMLAALSLSAWTFWWRKRARSAVILSEVGECWESDRGGIWLTAPLAMHDICVCSVPAVMTLSRVPPRLQREQICKAFAIPFAISSAGMSDSKNEENCSPLKTKATDELVETVQWRANHVVTDAAHQRNMKVTVESLPRAELHFEDVVATLKVDFPTILHKEPTWGIFSEDFHVYDQTGVRLDGSRPSDLLNLLRQACKHFVLKDDIDVEFISYDHSGFSSKEKMFNGNTSNPDSSRWFDASYDVKPFLVARWNVQLGGLELPSGGPIDIEAEMIFHFNDENKVDYMWIDRRVVNGRQFISWPEVSLSHDPAANMDIIRKWAGDIQNLESLSPASTDTCEDECLVKRMELFDRDLIAELGLQADLPHIMIQEPNWDYFSEDFKMIAEDVEVFGKSFEGFEIKGLSTSQWLLRSLRDFHNKLATSPVRDDFRIETEVIFEERADGSAEEVLVARWSLRYYQPKLEIPGMEKPKTGLLTITGDSRFRFNPEGKIISMKVNDWLLNGKKVNCAWVIFAISLLDDIAGVALVGGGATAAANKDDIADTLDTVADTVDDMADKVADHVDVIADRVSDHADAVADKMGDHVDAIVDKVGDHVDAVVDRMSSHADQLADTHQMLTHLLTHCSTQGDSCASHVHSFDFASLFSRFQEAAHLIAPTLP